MNIKVEWDYNPCYACAYSDGNVTTCSELHGCDDWKHFYNEDNTLIEDDTVIYISDGLTIAGKINKEEIKKILNKEKIK